MHTLLALAVLVAACAADTSQLCDTCRCELRARMAYDCSHAASAVIDLLYADASYMDAANNNSLYHIDVLNLTHLPLMHVKVFPRSALKVLDLTDANLLSIDDEAFRNLQEMRELKLGRNRLEELSPDAFKGLRVDGKDYPLLALKILHLEYNNLHSIHNDAFQHIEQTLEELHLQGNPLKVIDLPTLQAIHGVLGLRVLDLSGTQLAALPEHFLHTPGHLEELRIADNQLTNVTCLSLHMAHALKKLVLDGNPIARIAGETAFPPVPTLEVLHMCRMPQLGVLGNHSLCELSGLQELHLADNPRLHSIGEQAFIRADKDSEVPLVQRLRKLNISGNSLTRLPLMIEWAALQDLDINGNPWTCECENQWMLDTLLPIYCAINEQRCRTLACAAPIEMEGLLFHELSARKYEMRCLDAYGNHPENDGIILVCFMLGLLMGIVGILAGVYAWKRNWLGLCDGSPAAYSRQFYGRAATAADDF